MGSRPLLAAAASALLLTACYGPRASITSNKAATADLHPRRDFVLSQISDRRAGLHFGEPFAKVFEDRAEEIIHRCEAEEALYRVTGIEIDPEIVAKSMAAFNPDSVLRIQKTHGTAMAGGSVLVSADYDVSLLQVGPTPAAKEKGGGLQTAWRAALTFRPSDHSFGLRTFASDGQAFADEVFNKLKSDGFFPGCAPTRAAPPDAGRAPAPSRS